MKTNRVVVVILALLMAFGCMSACSEAAPSAKKQAEDVALITGLSADEVKETYEKAEAYYNTGDYLNAINHYEKVPGYMDSNSKAESALSLYQDQVVDTVKSISQDTSRCHEALSLVAEARKTVGDCAAFASTEAEVKIGYANSIIEEAQEALDSKDYDAAESYIEMIEQLVTRDYGVSRTYGEVLYNALNKENGKIGARMDEIMNLVEIGRIIAKWETLQNQGKTVDSLLFLRETISEGIDYPEIVDLFNKEYDAYKKGIIDAAEATFLTSGYEAAIGALQQGTLVLYDDADFIHKMEEYQSYKPIPLTSLDYFDIGNGSVGSTDGSLIIIEKSKDNLGQEHKNIFYSSRYQKGGYITYRLFGKYVQLTGLCFLNYEHRSYNADGRYLIYGDDVLLYDSGKMEKGMDPIQFEINITGVDKLKIVYEGKSEGCRLGDPILYREMPKSNTTDTSDATPEPTPDSDAG